MFMFVSRLSLIWLNNNNNNNASTNDVQVCSYNTHYTNIPFGIQIGNKWQTNIRQIILSSQH